MTLVLLDTKMYMKHCILDSFEANAYMLMYRGKEMFEIPTHDRPMLTRKIATHSQAN